MNSGGRIGGSGDVQNGNHGCGNDGDHGGSETWSGSDDSRSRSGHGGKNGIAKIVCVREQLRNRYRRRPL